ncbi:cation/H(+) antiporter 14-like [Silene latifolia]|uniref:cation/H(+) antiporter 14-like n=1 Tax=Silene latifolia TaxID=37657 RepID=UPI003D770115
MGDRTSIAWNEGNTTEGISIACQGFVMHSNVFGGIIRKVSSGLLFDVGIFLILYRFVRTLLKPLDMPFASQLLLLVKLVNVNLVGMYTDKFRMEITFKFFAAYITVNTTHQQFNQRVIPVIFSINASNYLLSTSSHLNDLRISNSKLGQLASSTSMVTDMSVICGMPMALLEETLDVRSYRLVIIIVMGYIGKFLGVIIPACFLRLPFSQATSLALIMSTRGVLDIPSILSSFKTGGLTPNHYAILILYSSITMGVLLPLVRLLYEPSTQYSTIIRRGVIDFQENSEVLLILVCIHKEETLPGLVHFLKAFYSTQQNPISILALQLLQLTGQCAMPIMAPLHEVSSISSLLSNIDRSNRIVNSFLHLERDTDGKTRSQHYVAISPYETMYNDICNLAYEKAVGLVILPFHISSGPDGTIIESSLAIREVINMVLKKAPCSVGLLVDRSSSQKHVIEKDAYMIWIVFIGGADDYEALAYGKIFSNHPCVRLHVIWLKPPKSDNDNVLDNEVMKKFRRSCKNNEKISFKEVVVNNGDETIQFMVSIKDDVNLILTGKFHNVHSVPLLGLSDGWSEYPELGILGDVFASSDFESSLLVVQHEPQNELDLDFEGKLH